VDQPRGTRRSRDRRGRGRRGPAVLPGPLTPHGVPRTRNDRERFDLLVLDAVRALLEQWPEELREVEFAVEDTPVVPADWSAPTVPLASLVRREGSRAPRVVVFRRPLELRAEGLADLAALVHAVVVEQVAELLGREPEEVDPRYGES
jgi:predicted Zn-dependent protease with MMP-like domain